MTDNDIKKRFPFLKNIDFEDKRTKKNFVMIFLIIVLTIIVLCLAYVSKRKARLEAEGQQTEAKSPVRRSEVMELPQGEDRDDIGSENMITIHERRRTGKLAELYDSFSENNEDPMAVKEDNGKFEQLSVREDADRMFPGGRTTGGPETLSKGAEAKKPDTVEPVKKINRGGTPAPRNSSASSTKPSQPKAAETQEPPIEESAAETAPKPVTVRKSGGISSLDDGWGSVEGLSSLETESQYIEFDEQQPVKVMFLRDAKITSGQRVTLRLLDDIVAGGVVIPRNTHLSAICTIGDRLDLSVQNIEVNDKIIKLGYVAFDNDGNEGLYCPESSAKKKAKQVTDEAVSVGSSVLSSALSGLGIAGKVANTGTSLIRSATGTVTAQVTAGYEFYLLKEE